MSNTERIYLELIEDQDMDLLPAYVQWERDRNEDFPPMLLGHFQQMLVATIEAIEELEEAEQCPST